MPLMSNRTLCSRRPFSAVASVLAPLLVLVTTVLQPGAADDNTSFIDEIHNDWSGAVLDAANTIDGFFSTIPADEASQKTRLRVYMKLRHDGQDGTSLGGGLRGKLSLPRTEERLHIIFGSDEHEANRDLAEDDQNISLRIKPRSDKRRHKLRFDIGIRKRIGKYQPYGRMSHRKSYVTGGRSVPTLTNKLYYFTKAGFEYNGRIDFNRLISSHLFFRPTTEIRWYEENPEMCNDGFCFDQYFTLFQRLKHEKQQAIAYDLNFFLRNQPDLELNDAEVKLRYRRMTAREWLFWEIEPGVRFPAEQDHDATFRVTFRVEGVFGHNDVANINQDFLPDQDPWKLSD
jgi:hypothetical protein